MVGYIISDKNESYKHPKTRKNAEVYYAFWEGGAIWRDLEIDTPT